MTTNIPATPRIFVSHSHQDAAFCRAYVNGLRAHGLDVWYDEHNLGSGALRSTIERELQGRDHFIVILSPAAVSSDWVNAEIDGALALMRRGQVRMFLPVVAAVCDIPVLLDRYKRITGADGGSVGVDEAVARTVQALSGAASAPVGSPISGLSPAPGTELLAYDGHTETVWAIAWSPDGQQLATAGSDATVRVWNALTGEDCVVYRGHKESVYAVAWSPDGKWVASGGGDKTVQVWSATDGSHRVTYGENPSFIYRSAYGGHTGAIKNISWSPDGKRIVSSDQSNPQIWDVAEGKIIQTITGADHLKDWDRRWNFDGAAWDRDWKYVATRGPYSTLDSHNRAAEIEVVELGTGEIARTYRGHTKSITHLAWSLDSQRLASGASDHLVYVWDWSKSQDPLIFQKHDASISALSWSPSGRFIASADDVGIVYLWDAKGGRVSVSVQTDGGYGTRVAWSPDGKHFATTEGDKGLVGVWQAP